MASGVLLCSAHVKLLVQVWMLMHQWIGPRKEVRIWQHLATKLRFHGGDNCGSLLDSAVAVSAQLNPEGRLALGLFCRPVDYNAGLGFL